MAEQFAALLRQLARQTDDPDAEAAQVAKTCGAIVPFIEADSGMGDEAADAGAITHLVQAMRRFAEDAALQQQAIELLVLLATSSEGVQDRLLTDGVAPMMQHVLSLHVENEALQAAGALLARALWDELPQKHVPPPHPTQHINFKDYRLSEANRRAMEDLFFPDTTPAFKNDTLLEFSISESPSRLQGSRTAPGELPSVYFDPPEFSELGRPFSSGSTYSASNGGGSLMTDSMVSADSPFFVLDGEYSSGGESSLSPPASRGRSRPTTRGSTRPTTRGSSRPGTRGSSRSRSRSRSRPGTGKEQERQRKRRLNAERKEKQAARLDAQREILAKLQEMDPTNEWAERRARADLVGQAGDWQKYMDLDAHKIFYYNVTTGMSKWSSSHKAAMRGPRIAAQVAPEPVRLSPHRVKQDVVSSKLTAGRPSRTKEEPVVILARRVMGRCAAKNVQLISMLEMVDNGSESLSVLQFVKALRCVGIDLENMDVTRILRAFSNKGRVDYKSFCKAGGGPAAEPVTSRLSWDQQEAQRREREREATQLRQHKRVQARARRWLTLRGRKALHKHFTEDAQAWLLERVRLAKQHLDDKAEAEPWLRRTGLLNKRRQNTQLWLQRRAHKALTAERRAEAHEWLKWRASQAIRWIQRQGLPPSIKAAYERKYAYEWLLRRAARAKVHCLHTLEDLAWLKERAKRAKKHMGQKDLASQRLKRGVLQAYRRWDQLDEAYQWLRARGLRAQEHCKQQDAALEELQDMARLALPHFTAKIHAARFLREQGDKALNKLGSRLDAAVWLRTRAVKARAHLKARERALAFLAERVALGRAQIVRRQEARDWLTSLAQQKVEHFRQQDEARLWLREKGLAERDAARKRDTLRARGEVKAEHHRAISAALGRMGGAELDTEKAKLKEVDRGRQEEYKYMTAAQKRRQEAAYAFDSLELFAPGKIDWDQLEELLDELCLSMPSSEKQEARRTLCDDYGEVERQAFLDWYDAAYERNGISRALVSAKKIKEKTGVLATELAKRRLRQRVPRPDYIPSMAYMPYLGPSVEEGV